MNLSRNKLCVVAEKQKQNQLLEMHPDVMLRWPITLDQLVNSIATYNNLHNSYNQ